MNAETNLTERHETDVCYIGIKPVDLEKMIFGAANLINALHGTAYGWSVDGILKMDRAKSPAQNAIDYLRDYHEMSDATLDLIGGLMSALSNAIINDDISITFHKE